MTLTAFKEQTQTTTRAVHSNRSVTTAGTFGKAQHVDSQFAIDELFSNAQSVKDMTVANLVRAAQRGDQSAAGELFERYQNMVLSVAYRRLGDYVDAQELVQEVFVQALQKLGQLRTPECFGSWLRSITVRMAINRMVRGDRAVSTEPVTLEATLSTSETPDDRAITVERAQAVRDGISRLREMDRETLIAFYVNGQSLIQMSEAFNAPIGTIKRRLHVARQRLAKEIEHLVVN
jgi:RNA polymerase sigma-70 factor (ECF subfamily)